MNKALRHTIITLFSLTPIAYTAMVWDKIPETVAIHFDAASRPNGFAEKSSLWGYVLLLWAITIGVYFLMEFIDRVDPKRRGKPVPPIFSKLAVTTVIFLTALSLLIIMSSVYPTQMLTSRLLTPLIGLLFAVLGNYMHNLKPNYIAGIKLPWTLASDYNWKKTHHLAGWLWFAAGILLTILSLLLPSDVMAVVLNVFIAVIVIIPIAYSFILYRKEHENEGYYDKEK